MSVFCDSSALVKLYADEPGAELVRPLTDVVVSCLARVEVAGALWRKHRIGELSSEDAAILVEAFEADWLGAAFAIVDLTDQILDSSAHLLAVHPLRSLDALQLGTALVAHAADLDLVEFACFDERLADAARAEGFRALP